MSHLRRHIGTVQPAILSLGADPYGRLSEYRTVMFTDTAAHAHLGIDHRTTSSFPLPIRTADEYRAVWTDLIAHQAGSSMTPLQAARPVDLSPADPDTAFLFKG
jgi:hypothetical protein